MKRTLDQLPHGGTAPLAAVPGVRHPLRFELLGANAAAPGRCLEKLPGQVNYLHGERSQWRLGIPTYRRVGYRQVYPGIDLVHYGADGALEHDWVVHPGADPSRIRIRVRGAGTPASNRAATWSCAPGALWCGRSCQCATNAKAVTSHRTPKAGSACRAGTR